MMDETPSTFPSATEHRLRVRQEYGKQSIGSLAMFGDGGFINFGLWKNGHTFDKKNMAKKYRNEASKELYRFLWNQIGLLSACKKKGSITVLEVGCGTGAGLQLLIEDLSYGSHVYEDLVLIGQDTTDEQLVRAQHRLKEIGSNIDVPVILMSNLNGMDTNSIDIIYSVETLQTMDNLDEFIFQIERLLKTGVAGQIAFTMHLCPHVDKYDRLCDLIPTCPSPDRMSPLPVLLEALIKHKFVDIKVREVGEHVFPALGAFENIVHREECFIDNIVQAWREGVLEYYVVTARKCLRDSESSKISSDDISIQD